MDLFSNWSQLTLTAKSMAALKFGEKKQDERWWDSAECLRNSQHAISVRYSDANLMKKCVAECNHSTHVENAPGTWIVLQKKLASSSNQIIIHHIQRYLKYIISTISVLCVCTKNIYIYISVCVRIYLNIMYIHVFKFFTPTQPEDCKTWLLKPALHQRCSICMGVERKNCHGKGLEDLAGPWLSGSLPFPRCHIGSQFLPSYLLSGRAWFQSSPGKQSACKYMLKYMYQGIICIQKTLLKEQYDHAR